MVLIGQIFGWLAPLFAFLSYQCKTHKKLLIFQTLCSLSLCISYFLLGAWSGMLLNVVCLVRNFIIYKKNITFFSHPCWAYILAGVMALAGAVSWQGPLSLLMIVALVVNTLFLYFPNVQNLRKSLLVTSTMVLIYNLCFTVWGGVANEVIGISSAAIGLYRYRTNKEAAL